MFEPELAGVTLAFPMGAILLLMALCGAIADWRYLRRGGMPATRKQKQWIGIAVLLCIALLVILGLMETNAEGLGAVAGKLSVLLFAVWELSRWRVRRANPIRDMHSGH